MQWSEIYVHRFDDQERACYRTETGSHHFEQRDEDMLWCRLCGTTYYGGGAVTSAFNVLSALVGTEEERDLRRALPPGEPWATSPTSWRSSGGADPCRAASCSGACPDRGRRDRG